jgi:hypothetical protein
VPAIRHDCIGPVGLIAAVDASFRQPNTLIQESARAFYTGWYEELVTTVSTIKDGHMYPMKGPGLGVELLPSVFERTELTVRRLIGEDAPMSKHLFDLTGRTALVTALLASLVAPWPNCGRRSCDHP